MLCQACHRITPNRLLCEMCRRRLRPAPDRILRAGVPVYAAFVHTGPARTLMHHMKYRGHSLFADLVAEVLSARIPQMPLVPLPRALTRRARYAIDPAMVIAQRVADRLGAPTLNLLGPAVHNPRRAGGDHLVPVRPFRVRHRPDHPVLVVDDVLTTGKTLERAIEDIGPHLVRGAIVANVVPEVSSLRRPDTTAPQERL